MASSNVLQFIAIMSDATFTSLESVFSLEGMTPPIPFRSVSENWSGPSWKQSREIHEASANDPEPALVASQEL